MQQITRRRTLVSEEFRGEEQGCEEQASYTRFADREEKPCLFPIQGFCPASGHPAEGIPDDAKLFGICGTDGGEKDGVREQSLRVNVSDIAITL